MTYPKDDDGAYAWLTTFLYTSLVVSASPSNEVLLKAFSMWLPKAAGLLPRDYQILAKTVTCLGWPKVNAKLNEIFACEGPLLQFLERIEILSTEFNKVVQQEIESARDVSARFEPHTVSQEQVKT